MPDPRFSKKKMSLLLRPQSAAGSRHVVDKDSQQQQHPRPPVSKTIRPWSAHLRQRGELSPQKVLRPAQHLRKSHMKASGRHKDAEVEAVQRVLAFPSTKTARSSVESGGDYADLEVVTLVSAKQLHGETTKDTHTAEQTEDNKHVGPRKRHPSFETWVAGSPQDSDEYDTDLEENESKEQTTKKKVCSVQNDASGLTAYQEQCKKHGLVPVSFLRRHLGKRVIKMRHHYLGGNAARPVAYALRNNTVTETVDLSDNYLESTGAACLAAMLRDNTFIVSMNLSDNFIGSYGCATLANMLDVNTTLKSLNLAGNQLSDRDIHHFIDPLKSNMSLTSLDLSHNGLSEMAGLHLAVVLSVNDGLNDLDLSWNSIRKNGAVALANALKVNTVLEVLDLSWNGIGAEGTSALQQSLQVNTTLRVLDLTNNRIGTKAATKFATGLKKNFGLETVILNLNPIGDKGIEAILNAAALHQNLKFVSLEELGLSKEALQHIQRLGEEKGLIVLHGGSGGYHRNSSLLGVLRFFGRFCQDHVIELEAACQQQDKDHSHVLTADETKQCLRAAGIRLTSRQLDFIIDEIDFSHSGRINYTDILSGKVFSEYDKRRPSRGFSLSPGMQSRLHRPS
ncbi:leucine-rich repeat-containing protein 74A-like [Littorina saxatilis]|uniref:EF-hand domain-containing protein n=1 Tax=Littorina saxatilis TaxID=31220 RepID=A0AAN9B9B4_9CAEN